MSFTIMVLCVFLMGCLKPEPPKVDSISTNPITWTSCDNTLNSHPCDIETYDQFNLPTDLYSFYGRPIVLDFSAAWCPPCLAAAKEVQVIQDSAASEDLVYITVLMENTDASIPDEEDLARWAKLNEITKAPVWAGSVEMIDLEDQTNGWFILGYPTFYFIDKEMVIRGYNRGYQPEALHLEIAALLEE